MAEIAKPSDENRPHRNCRISTRERRACRLRGLRSEARPIDLRPDTQGLHIQRVDDSARGFASSNDEPAEVHRLQGGGGLGVWMKAAAAGIEDGSDEASFPPVKG